MNPSEYWNKSFSEAHLNSWPTAGISIQTQIVKANSDIIFQTAKKYGYEVLTKSSSMFCFINPKLKGLKYAHPDNK